MVDARGRADNNRRPIRFGQLERRLHHGAPFFGRARVQHRNLCEGREPTGVLFGLGGNRAGIVRYEQDRSAFDAYIVQAHERVARYVEADLLAGEQHARTCIGCARQELQRGLFVRGPFHVHALCATGRMLSCDRFDKLRRRRARIARDHAYARSQCRVCERFVSHVQLFAHSAPLFMDATASRRSNVPAAAFDARDECSC